jgi:pimeloyl-ACP methyl ester carboxylesterase
MNTLKRSAAIFLAVILLVTLSPSPAQAQVSSFRIHPSGKGWCIVVDDVPVSPAQGSPHSWTVTVQYCRPFVWTREVDVLTHGATYTHTYWDWQQQPATYSYVGKTLADGRATLAYDRIGNGGSGNSNGTRPLSTEITMASDAWVLHQLIRGLWFLGYWHINSISHSYGSGVALAEATTDYNDHIKVNAVVLTGYLHRPSNPAVTAGNYPANQDPMFVAAGLDNGYLTSRPGVRGTSFHAPTSDPLVVAYDDAHKDVVSLTGLLGFLGARGVPAGANISNLVTVPVLVVNGQQDAIFCYQPLVFDCADEAVVNANEAPFYGNVEVHTIPGSGHDLTLHPSASDSYAIISHWIENLP